MDLSQIDNIIERLEKRRSLRPGSPPVVLGGHLGVWRTIRAYRVFLELNSEGGLGRVLIGPPSFVGRTLNEVSDSAWEALAPRHTLEMFRDVKVASNGIETLRQSIKNSLEANDTRHRAASKMKTSEQLIPLARSVGFSDDEIKQALTGTSPNKPIEELSSRRSALGDRPVTGNEAKRTEASSTQDMNAYISDALARVPQAAKGAKGDEKNKKIADFLDEVVVKKLKEKGEDIFAKKVKDLANSLRAGKFTQSEVEERIKEVVDNRSALKNKMLNDQQRTVLEDSVKVKTALDNFDQELSRRVDQKIEESSAKFKPKRNKVSEDRVRELADEVKTQSERAIREAEQQRKETQRMREEAAAERRRAQEFVSDAQKARYEVEAALDLLSSLANELKSEKAKKEIKKIVDEIGKSPFSRRSILLRLYQLLQILLLLIPIF